MEDTNCLSLLASVLIRRDALRLALSLHLEIILQKERHKDKDHQSTVWCSLFKATKWQGLSQTFPIGCSYKKDKQPSWTLLRQTARSRQRNSLQNRTDHYTPCSHSLSGTMEMFWQTSSALLCSSFRGLTLRRGYWRGMRPSLLERIRIYQMARASYTNITEFFGYMHPWGVPNGLRWSQIIFFVVNKMEGLILKNS